MNDRSLIVVDTFALDTITVNRLAIAIGVMVFKSSGGFLFCHYFTWGLAHADFVVAAVFFIFWRWNMFFSWNVFRNSLIFTRITNFRIFLVIFNNLNSRINLIKLRCPYLRWITNISHSLSSTIIRIFTRRYWWFSRSSTISGINSIHRLIISFVIGLLNASKSYINLFILYFFTFYF